MSISPRIARTSRCIGVAVASAALVFGAAGNAMASSIKDFSAVAECDGDKGVIRVTDVDPLGIKAEITVYLENNGADLRKVGSRTIENSTAEGVTITFEEDWEPNAEYRIHVTADKYVDEDIAPNLVAPAEACGKEADTPPAPAESPEKPAQQEPSEAEKSPTPPTSKNTASAGTSNNNVPSAEGGSDLAETGTDAGTGPIAGAAAALVALGAGAMYYSTRRRGASTR
ncbi:LAETG motif-containing sortase-dependent surface protein [Streptomyces sp. TG1A-60]|uniref:LAETG motif-containing sortase-dependent surface protein n=1 Tax=Streptomyces sp. TG1A-60 TaxID=3129111 RepID=UPI0030CF5299